jgi:hypothetical protein
MFPYELFVTSNCWILQVGFVTFFLSSVLDNLTSTIVMVSLLRKLVPPSEYRKYVLEFLRTYPLPIENIVEYSLILVSHPDLNSRFHIATMIRGKCY